MAPPDFPLFDAESRFTDDTVLTVATAQALLEQEDYRQAYARYYLEYPRAGYGGMFIRWARQGAGEPYQSFGNGSAMRVSPVGWWCQSLEDTLREAERSAAVTHNHPEGIKGAKAIAGCVFLARQRQSKETIRNFVVEDIGYPLPENCREAYLSYACDATCMGSVPPAIVAFLEARDFEHAIRLAISMGGDTDTIACMAGAIGEPFYGLPPPIRQEAKKRLNQSLREIVERFMREAPDGT